MARLGRSFPIRPKYAPSSQFQSHQFVGPIADIAVNGWLASTGPDLYAMLDEVNQDDTDYVYSPNNPTTEQFEVKLAPMPDPNSSDGHAVIVGRAANQTTNFDLNLVQGTTVLDSWTETVLTGTGVTLRTHTLSAAVADSITDYTDLRIRCVARA